MLHKSLQSSDMSDEASEDFAFLDEEVERLRQRDDDLHDVEIFFEDQELDKMDVDSDKSDVIGDFGQAGPEEDEPVDDLYHEIMVEVLFANLCLLFVSYSYIVLLGDSTT